MAINGRPPQKPGASPPPQSRLCIPPWSSAPDAFLDDAEMMPLLLSFFSEDEEYQTSTLIDGAVSTNPATASSTGSDLRLMQSQEGLMASAPSGMFSSLPAMNPTASIDSSGVLSHLPVPHGIPHQQAVGQISARTQQPNGHRFRPEYVTDSTDCAPTLVPVTLRSPAHNHKARTNALAVDKFTDGEYNWRRAGKRPVKGSVSTRYYCKCKISGCPAKKQVERSWDGQITRTAYRLEHNHQPTISGEQLSGMRDGEELDWGDDETQREVRFGDEPTLKIRITNVRAVTEPKTIIQTPSEIDALADGYRWQNHGKKFLKANPNPRRYYKCLTPGCDVRKHIERSQTDRKCFITTYTGRHNHAAPVPATRTRRHKVTNSVAGQNDASGNNALGDKGDSSR